MTNQEISDKIFDDLVNNRITRLQFVEEYDRLYYLLSENEKHQLSHRKDRRPLGDYALQIYDNTRREKFLIDSWCRMVLRRKMFKSVNYIDQGMDNSGKLIISSRKGPLADYRVLTKGGTLLPDGTNKVEVKFGPSLMKATFKVSQLKAYISEGSYMLVILSSGQLGPSGHAYLPESYVIDPRNTRWFLVSPSDMQRMLQRDQKQSYEMGGKISVQFLGPEIVEFFNVYDWS